MCRKRTLSTFNIQRSTLIRVKRIGTLPQEFSHSQRGTDPRDDNAQQNLQETQESQCLHISELDEVQVAEIFIESENDGCCDDN